MDTLYRCRMLLRSDKGYTSFARINDDSTWHFEVTEVEIVGRKQRLTRHILSNVSARDALPFLQDLINSAKTEANYGGKL